MAASFRSDNISAVGCRSRWTATVALLCSLSGGAWAEADPATTAGSEITSPDPVQMQGFIPDLQSSRAGQAPTGKSGAVGATELAPLATPPPISSSSTVPPPAAAGTVPPFVKAAPAVTAKKPERTTAAPKSAEPKKSGVASASEAAKSTAHQSTQAQEAALRQAAQDFAAKKPAAGTADSKTATAELKPDATGAKATVVDSSSSSKKASDPRKAVSDKPAVAATSDRDSSGRRVSIEGRVVGILPRGDGQVQITVAAADGRVVQGVMDEDEQRIPRRGDKVRLRGNRIGGSADRPVIEVDDVVASAVRKVYEPDEDEYMPGPEIAGPIVAGPMLAPPMMHAEIVFDGRRGDGYRDRDRDRDSFRSGYRRGPYAGPSHPMGGPGGVTVGGGPFGPGYGGGPRNRR